MNMTTKNITFALGLAFLLFGALTFHLQDWDVGVSLVMAFCTYFSADWAVGVIRRLEWKQWPKAAFLVWFSVQGSYGCYWLLMRQTERMVEGQWVTSLFMYLLCGVIWQALPQPREALALVRSTMGRFLSHQR